MKTFLTLGALALVALPHGAAAQDGVLFDYRDADFRMGQAFYSASERQQVAAGLDSALVDELGPEFVIVGDAEGAFGAGDSTEEIYLLQSQPAVALEPFPDAPAPVLAVFKDEKAIATYRLPKEVQYQRLIGASDVNGDGIADVLLESSFMNMGQIVSSVDVFDLSGGEAKLLQSLPEVFSDACENPAGEQTLSASTISPGPDGLLVAESHALDCPS